MRNEETRGKRQFFKTTFSIEVLSVGPFTTDDSYLDAINNAIIDGPCSGEVILTKTEELTGPEMAQALITQGSDPQFLGLDDEGNEED